MQWTIIQLSPKCRMSGSRSSTICVVIEQSDHHCGDDLVVSTLTSQSQLDTMTIAIVWAVALLSGERWSTRSGWFVRKSAQRTSSSCRLSDLEFGLQIVGLNCFRPLNIPVDYFQTEDTSNAVIVSYICDGLFSGLTVASPELVNEVSATESVDTKRL